MVTGVTPLEIRDAVRQMFDRVADTPGEKYRFEVGPHLARAVGYPPDVLDSLPPAATDAFTGLAYLHPHLGPAPGERVLDLGSGAGLDAILAGGAVSPGGAVVGLELSASMVCRARALATALRVDNVSFERGEAEAMPFDEATFDAALVNGLFNLCPDKAGVARELYRVLRPGGRAVVAEITFAAPRPPKEIQTVDDWFR